MIGVLVFIAYIAIGLLCATGLLAWVNKESFIDSDDRFMAGLTVFAWPITVITFIVCLSLKKFLDFVEKKLNES